MNSNQILLKRKEFMKIRISITSWLLIIKQGAILMHTLPEEETYIQHLGYSRGKGFDFRGETEI